MRKKQGLFVSERIYAMGGGLPPASLCSSTPLVNEGGKDAVDHRKWMQSLWFWEITTSVSGKA